MPETFLRLIRHPPPYPCTFLILAFQGCLFRVDSEPEGLDCAMYDIAILSVQKVWLNGLNARQDHMSRRIFDVKLCVRPNIVPRWHA